MLSFFLNPPSIVWDITVSVFDSTLLRQEFGTAIGTSCAPPYSGLYMEELTTQAFQAWQERHPDPDNNMQSWVRLIDDGWGMWSGSLGLLREFVEFLSSQAPSMKFTFETTCPREGCPEVGEGHECQQFLVYLDLKMHINGEGKIQTDLHRKPGRKCQYLSPDSAHPRHV